ncbi:unnamed protein product [Tenebrio molitor]|jgi:hypothetical protein|nr:unnamed protein product [Tenebrio molitor]
MTLTLDMSTETDDNSKSLLFAELDRQDKLPNSESSLFRSFFECHAAVVYNKVF